MHSCENEIYRLFVNDVKGIISVGMARAYNATNREMIDTYWQIGRRIVEEEQHGQKRAEYGAKLMDSLSFDLTSEFGSGYSKRNLQYFRKFYQLFPDIEILHTRMHNLSWSHFKCLIHVPHEDARLWYMNEASHEGWGVKTLVRNIATQYYHRLLASPKKDIVRAEMKEKTAAFPVRQFELIKSPLVAEFLGFKTSDSYAEKDLEGAIITHIKDFLMEMGRGFAFVGRQQHIVTDDEDYYIDLVLYNIELRCYVIIDLKMGKITHQDVGQMDMYVRMYDELKRKEGDNPTIGIVLCSKTDKDIARFSVLHESKQLFMAKYLTFLPTPEELGREIEREKEIFYLQHPDVKPL